MPVFVDVPDVHRQLVTEVLDKAIAFLRLKDSNSVRILFTCRLDSTVEQDSRLNESPVLVRARITRHPLSDLRCEFRLASARSEISSKNATFEELKKCFCSFFDDHFHPNHWYRAFKIEVRVIMCDPLGALAVMEGQSHLWPASEQESFSLDFNDEDPALSEV